MYNYIINPSTNKKVSIKTKKGQEILNSYLILLLGGSTQSEKLSKDNILKKLNSLPSKKEEFLTLHDNYMRQLVIAVYSEEFANEKQNKKIKVHKQNKNLASGMRKDNEIIINLRNFFKEIHELPDDKNKNKKFIDNVILYIKNDINHIDEKKNFPFNSTKDQREKIPGGSMIKVINNYYGLLIPGKNPNLGNATAMNRWTENRKSIPFNFTNKNELQKWLEEKAQQLNIMIILDNDEQEKLVDYFKDIIPKTTLIKTNISDELFVQSETDYCFPENKSIIKLDNENYTSLSNLNNKKAKLIDEIKINIENLKT